MKDQVESVLADFHPDLIHVFGLECPLSEIIENIDIPSVVHLQGIINPVAISYLPFGFSSETLRKHGVWWRENIFNNGFKYYYNETLRRCKREKQLYKVLKCCTGRTDWDKAVTELYAPQCQYYNVNEILRPDFYSTLPINPRDKIEVLKIASTISETIYKGLDLIVKTAKILNEFDIKFEWRIIGVKANSAYVNLVKHTLGMQISSNVVFEGVKNPQEIIEILDTTDVYVHPSYIDNSPNSVCEAQLLGVPVIATNVGGVSSLITSGETGILVPTNEPHILTSKLIEIKNNFELRKMLSLSGRNAALKRHNCNDIINKIIAIYQNLTNAKA
ncbi:glycosyltransferase family 4 protein [uncultured Muribaculum sp.]|uniref:glycosyltransferase family 4 protein n=1 Tax=uncultured Muribaculum sp. TaxID=1918613 RepID=UPI0025EAD4D3|nr:glycosyltransferase [uncultured Muribaculum sp.]